MEEENDYIKYRGKCKEFAEAAVADNCDLTLVRGFYYCPLSNRTEQHWWTKRKNGSIYDPSAKQFLSKGLGEYKEFDGFYECEQCGKQVHEANAQSYGNYIFCSSECIIRCCL